MKLTYIFDPLCGWCYGAIPAIDWLMDESDIEISLAPSGMFAERPRQIDADSAAYAWQNDQRIAKLTGQQFTQKYQENVLNAKGLFDSAPATLGVIAAGLETNDIDKYRNEYFALKSIQEARYIDGLDNSNLEIIISILEKIGLTNAAKRIAAPDDALITAYQIRIAETKSEINKFNIQGVPALILSDGENQQIIPNNALYMRDKNLLALLKQNKKPTE